MAKEEKVTLSIEESLKKLDEIVNVVENETLPLEKSLAIFEEGMNIIKDLEKRLSEAESKLAKIVKDDNTIEDYKD